MLTAKLTLERFDTDLKLLERRELPSRSFLANFIKLLYVTHCQITETAPYSMNDITNTARNVDSESTIDGTNRGIHPTLRMGAPAGLSSVYCITGVNSSPVPGNVTVQGHLMGIVVGTGVGAVTPTDVALGTKIAHGRGAGELEYGGCELVGIAFADPNGQFTIRRYFTNNSGGGITVQEVGIYAVGADKGTTGANCYAWSFCIARDLTGGIAVANTELLRATYTALITV